MILYFQMHQDIKHREDIVFGAEHLFAEIRRINDNFKGVHRNLLLANVQINCYFAHPENLLLGMLGELHDLYFRRYFCFIAIITTPYMAHNLQQIKFQPKSQLSLFIVPFPLAIHHYIRHSILNYTIFR